MIALLPPPAIGCQGVPKLLPVYGVNLSKQDGLGAGNFEGSGPLTRAAGVSTRRELQGPWDEPRSEVGATAVCSPTNLTGGPKQWVRGPALAGKPVNPRQRRLHPECGRLSHSGVAHCHRPPPFRGGEAGV